MKKRKVALVKVFLVVGTMAFLMCASAGGLRAERKNYSIYTSLEGVSSTGGVGAAEWKEIAVLAVRKIGELAGINLHPMFTPTWKDLFRKIEKGKVDFVYLPAVNYVRLKNAGIKFEPISVFNFGSTPRYCIYVNSKDIRSLRDLDGKKLVMSWSYLKRLTNFPSDDPYQRYLEEWMIHDFVILRQWLDREGIGTLRDSGIRFSIDFPNSDSGLIALDKGMVDGAFCANSSIFMVRRRGKEFRNVRELACTDEIHAGLVAATGRVPKSLIENIKKAIEDMAGRPDSDVQELTGRLGLEGKNVGLMVVDDDDFKGWYDLWREAEEKGWIEEVEGVVKELIEEAQGKPAEVKGDYQFCKEKCADVENKDTCMDECME